jgi:hypothetical protein
VSRIRGDELATGVGAGLAAARGKYSEGFLHAIEWALKLDEKIRPQSVEQWKAAVLAERRVSPTVPLRTAERRTVRVAEVPAPSRRRWPIIVVLALLGVAAFGLWKKQRAPAPAPVSVPAATAPAAPAAAPAARDAQEDQSQRDKTQRLRQEVEREFKSADANGDGYLSLEEARARFPAVAQNFKRIDRDDDGRISPAEFMAAKRAFLERRLNK